MEQMIKISGPTMEQMIKISGPTKWGKITITKTTLIFGQNFWVLLIGGNICLGKFVLGLYSLGKK